MRLPLAQHVRNCLHQIDLYKYVAMNYFKRFFIGHLLNLVIVAVSISLLQGTVLLAGLLFAGLLELLFYYLDAKYLPKRKKFLANRLIQVFAAQTLTDEVLKFKLGDIDFYAVIDVDFKAALQIGNAETINIHVPCTQIGRLSSKPVRQFKENSIDGVLTSNIYQINGLEIDQARKYLIGLIEQ
jgi:hypothetical protein